MDYRRFYSQIPIDKTVLLIGDEFLHCVKVTRHKVGFLIIACDGSGFDYLAKITEINKDSLAAEVVSRTENKSEPLADLVLYQAVCKEFDFIVRKAVELGATRIVPIKTQFSLPQDINYDRLRTVITEAAKQCGRAKLPTLGIQIPFEECLNEANTFDNKIFCYEKCTGGGVTSAVRCTGSTAIVIGAEGGFSEEEAALAERYGLAHVSLGKRVLRAETAAIAALTLALSALGEL